MASLSSSCSIRSPMAAEPFSFSCSSIPRKAVSGMRNVGCCCVVRNDGTQARAAKALITCSAGDKVYEDRVKGIACYIDGNGEIVCEGYDEGPRANTPCLFSHPRDVDGEVDVIELLERSWLQLAKAEAASSADEFLN